MAGRLIRIKSMWSRQQLTSIKEETQNINQSCVPSYGFCTTTETNVPNDVASETYAEFLVEHSECVNLKTRWEIFKDSSSRKPTYSESSSKTCMSDKPITSSLNAADTASKLKYRDDKILKKKADLDILAFDKPAQNSRVRSQFMAQVGNIFRKMYTNHSFTDVTIHIEDLTFKAHKVILMTHSEYFLNKILYIETIPQKEIDVFLRGIPPNAFSVILQFMYTGNVVLTRKNIAAIHYAAKQFKMRNLLEKCLNDASFILDNSSLNDTDTLTYALDATEAGINLPLEESSSRISLKKKVHFDLTAMLKPSAESAKHHLANVGETLRIMYEYNIHTDVILLVDEYTFSAHKEVLITHSEYFCTILRNSNWQVNGKTTLQVDNVPPIAIPVILEYMYTSDVILYTENIGDIHHTAQILIMKDLLRKCEKKLQHLNKHDALIILDTSCNKNTDICDRALEVIFKSVPEDEKLPGLLNEKEINILTNALKANDLGVSTVAENMM